MIFLTEEGVGTLPHKFLFRYFQVFVPPLFILFVKYKEEFLALRSPGVWIMMAASLGVAGIYFFCMKGTTRQAIMDGHLFLFLENATKYVVPYADVLAVVFLFAVFCFALWSGRKKKAQEFMKFLMRAAVVCLALFWFIEAASLPYYSNVVADGRTVQADSVKIAEWLNREGYEYVYYVYGDDQERRSYCRNFYGYVRQQYAVMPKEKVGTVLKEQGEGIKTAFLFLGEWDMEKAGLQRVDLDTERIKVCVPL